MMVPRPYSTTDGLRHHGDAELEEGLVDFAVNVHDGPRPEWLDTALRASLDDVGRYPDSGEAETALARRHGRETSEVLATAGAAEAFALIARARDWTRPVVVHPQFTEPDVALTLAGHTPEHVLLDAAAGFALDPDAVPADADLVVVGNPTNPTSVLHPEATLRALARPGRMLVVDEAFMDSVPGEHESLASARILGVVVVRSLTKLWAIPGVRAGYVLAEPSVVAELRAQQSPWSVSTTAAAAMVACAGEEAIAESAARATRLTQHRSVWSTDSPSSASTWSPTRPGRSCSPVSARACMPACGLRVTPSGVPTRSPASTPPGSASPCADPTPRASCSRCSEPKVVRHDVARAPRRGAHGRRHARRWRSRRPGSGHRRRP